MGIPVNKKCRKVPRSSEIKLLETPANLNSWILSKIHNFVHIMRMPDHDSKYQQIDPKQRPKGRLRTTWKENFMKIVCAGEESAGGLARARVADRSKWRSICHQYAHGRRG